MKHEKSKPLPELIDWRKAADAAYVQGKIQGNYDAFVMLSAHLQALPPSEAKEFFDRHFELAIAEWRKLDK